jgi:hypothetical protein
VPDVVGYAEGENMFKKSKAKGKAADPAIDRVKEAALGELVKEEKKPVQKAPPKAPIARRPSPGEKAVTKLHNMAAVCAAGGDVGLVDVREVLVLLESGAGKKD